MVLIFVFLNLISIFRLAGCTDTIWIYGLNAGAPDGRSWQNVVRILKKYYPDNCERIVRTVMDRKHPYWEMLRHGLRELMARKGLDLRIHV